MTREPVRAAIEASRRWYDIVFALHGIPARADDRLWVAHGEPPPWHSAVKTLSPKVDGDLVLEAMEPHLHGSVADSFGILDLGKYGFDLLIEASWVVHEGVSEAAWPAGWSVVDDAGLLAKWCLLHDYEDVLTPAILSDPRCHVLARIEDEQPIGGAILHDGGQAVGMSNLWSGAGAGAGAGERAGSDDGERAGEVGPEDVAEVLACAGILYPGRSVTDFSWGAELDAVMAAGFVSVGPQRVWAR